MPLLNNKNNNNCKEKIIVKTVSPIKLKSSSNMLQEEDYFLKPSYKSRNKQIKSSQSDLITCESIHNSSLEVHDSSCGYTKKNNLSSSFSNIITSVRNSFRFVRSSSPMPPGNCRSSSLHTSQIKAKPTKTKTKSSSPSPNKNHVNNLDTISTSTTNTSLRLNDKTNITQNASKKDRMSRSTDNKRNASSERVFFSLLRFNLERKFRKHKEKKPKQTKDVNNSSLLSPNNQHEQFYSTNSLNNLNRGLISKSKDLNLMNYIDSRLKVS